MFLVEIVFRSLQQGFGGKEINGPWQPKLVVEHSCFITVGEPVTRVPQVRNRKRD